MQQKLLTPVATRQLAERYDTLLQEYLSARNETTLHYGYELGRGALGEGRGILEMAALHHEVLQDLIQKQSLNEGTLQAAEAFFIECLSPFEMSHRGAREGTLALRHLNEILEAEIQRIAHALHDEAGQLLASVYILLADISARLPSETRSRFHEAEGMLREIEMQLRDLSHEIRPTVLDNLGLVAALEFLADKVARRTGMVISVEAETQERLPAPVEAALYRIVQEALNNTVKHAHAQIVAITLTHSSSNVSCSIRDDGQGFTMTAESQSKGLGLMGIRERLNALGGMLRIVTKPQSGTELFIDIPFGG
jgi:signal transduction histidine kinase